MPIDHIVINQRVTQEKRELAKQLRQNMTPAERELWSQLRANRLGGWHFRRQQIIDGFIVDFYCHQAALVIEVDGEIHEQQKEADAERQAILEEKGLTVIRFTNRQVMNRMREVKREITLTLSQLENPPPNPLPQSEGEPKPSEMANINRNENISPPPPIGEGLGEGL